MYHSWKHGSHLKYSVTVKNMGHTQKEVSLLEKWVTLQTMCHSCKNKSHLKKCGLVKQLGSCFNFNAVLFLFLSSPWGSV